jgi:hypothetical protein
MKKVFSEEHEQKQIEKETVKKEHKPIDKKSTRNTDLMKRIEIIEKLLGLD